MNHFVLAIALCLGVVQLASVPSLSAQTDLAPSPLLAEAEELKQQAERLVAEGRYREAIPLAEQTLAIHKRIWGARSPQVALHLYNLAALHDDLGRYDRAESLYRQALALYETTTPPSDRAIATVLYRLAALARERGNYADAEELYERSLSLYEITVGREHPFVATVLYGWGGLQRERGNSEAAESLYSRALAIRENASDRIAIANSLHDLALLLYDRGDYAEAETLYRQALATYEGALGKDHPFVAMTLFNQAMLAQAQQDFDRAERLHLRAIEIRAAKLGEEHPSIAKSHLALGWLYHETRQYNRAEPFYRQAIALQAQILGREHPDFADSLNSLALLHFDRGDYEEAKPLYEKSLAIWERTLGSQHPLVARSLNNQALLYLAMGDGDRALELRSRNARIEEANLSLIFGLDSEAQKQAYTRLFTETTAKIISQHLQYAPKSDRAARLALETILRRKGRILDAVIQSRRVFNDNPESRKLRDSLSATRNRLSALIFHKPEDLSVEEYEMHLKALREEAERLEIALSHQSPVRPPKTVTIEAIRASLPDDAALLEFVRYEPFNAKTTQWGKPRYAAYILSPHNDIQWVDLGDADVIDEAARQFRRSLTNVRRPVNVNVIPASRALARLLWQPLQDKLGHASHLLIAPDSRLNLIPFAALLDNRDRYLVENYTITYLTTGRELLRWQDRQPSDRPPVLIANPTYHDNPDAPPLAREMTGLMAFDDLPGTAAEAEEIATLLPDTRLLTRERATESAIARVESPKILHVATHGFFLPVPESVAMDDPLLRSGLALAGANSPPRGTDDGILTALEMASLQLRGTQLAVLSACDTGLGEIEAGEGVYGMRRSLSIAGAESQAISLWKVSDEGTKELMARYYRYLVGGRGRSEAMRLAQLEMLKSGKYSHPFYWSAFIPSGNWQAIAF